MDAELQEGVPEKSDEPPLAPIDVKSIERAVGAAVSVKSHLEKDEKDQCAYCGQEFPPDEIVIEKEFYGRTWAFCSEDWVEDFREKSNFKDEDLDDDTSDQIDIGH